ncbi:hypothetical protein BDV97DRAFT_352716 [Delphinella strobiligena]|nr:hypothetical protein BDV97DRAFT_352716 [Delphinella strobiligena]
MHHVFLQTMNFCSSAWFLVHMVTPSCARYCLPSRVVESQLFPLSTSSDVSKMHCKPSPVPPFRVSFALGISGCLSLIPHPLTSVPLLPNTVSITVDNTHFSLPSSLLPSHSSLLISLS